MNVQGDSGDTMAVSHDQAFESSYSRTMQAEGLYSDNPLDPGGQTFMGISRHWHPRWPGWKMIDQCGPRNIPDYILSNLEALAAVFYRDQFWYPIQGDKLSTLSVTIAAKVFDTAVNVSVKTAVGWLQDALNLLNVNARLYPDMIIDGRLGPVTIERLGLYIITRPMAPSGNVTRLLSVYSFLQGGFYIEQMRRHPEREVFRGWFDRAAK